MTKVQQRIRKAVGLLTRLTLVPAATLPPLPVDIFYVSLGASYGLMLLAIWLGGPDVLGTVVPRTPTLDYVTSQWFLDPLLVNVGSACVAASLLYMGRRTRIRWAPAWSKAVRCLLPFLVLGVVLLLGDFVVKPAFNYDRRADPLPEPPIVRWVEEHVPFLGKSEGDSAPSGFVMRQVAMLYLLLWAVWRPRGRPWAKALTLLFALSMLGFVTFSRTYRSAHTVFDIMLALAVGTLLFWTITAVPVALMRVRWVSESKHLFCALGLTYLAFGVSLFAVSQNASLFLQVFATGVILAFLALASPGLEITREVALRR